MTYVLDMIVGETYNGISYAVAQFVLDNFPPVITLNCEKLVSTALQFYFTGVMKYTCPWRQRESSQNARNLYMRIITIDLMSAMPEICAPEKPPIIAQHVQPVDKEFVPISWITWDGISWITSCIRNRFPNTSFSACKYCKHWVTLSQGWIWSPGMIYVWSYLIKSVCCMISAGETDNFIHVSLSPSQHMDQWWFLCVIGCFTIRVHSCILECYKHFPKRGKVLIQWLF